MARIFVMRDGRLLGSFVIANKRQPISVSRLRETIAENLALKVLEEDQNLSADTLWAKAITTLAEHYLPRKPEITPLNWLIDLSRPLLPLTNVLRNKQTRITVMWQQHHLGEVEIANHYQPISVMRLRDVIVEGLGLKFLEPEHDLSKDIAWSCAVTALTRHFISNETEGRADSESLPPEVSVSVVIATFDRPDDLRHCLRCLAAQVSSRRIEIVVVDNHPNSELTPKVVAEFPEVMLVNEPRQGLAYARNTGFTASSGDIVIATDDDVIMPPDWVEQLIKPFIRNDVMIVAGNILPIV
ncbi:MAG: glycosyltransferase family 2 protein [bacterium]